MEKRKDINVAKKIDTGLWKVQRMKTDGKTRTKGHMLWKGFFVRMYRGI